MIVSNASPLIYLAKIKKLILLKKIFKEITVPYEVYEEVVIEGKRGSFHDAFAVENAKEEGWLKVKEPIADSELRILAQEIDYGEAAAITIAKKYCATLVLLDDASARTIAQSSGLKVKGTIFVILTAYKKKIISKQDARHLMALLVKEGFRISHELYAKTLEEIDRL